ncbi:MAG: V-type ATPase subunit [Clostridiales bacterium]|nr:V-type ATPase subunit [Clostridiales bacterium]
MAPHRDDRDYCFLTTRLRSLEAQMLNRERMELMLEAGNTEEAARILQECGYGEISDFTAQGLEAALSAEREKTFADVAFFAPDQRMLDIFRIKYDYHNAKVLLKSEALGLDSQRLLSEAGRLPSRQLAQALLTSYFIGIPLKLQYALAEAREMLGTTRDPQLADSLLDRAYYAEMHELALETESKFLEDYVRVSIDAANLKSAVRSTRIGKGADFLRSMLHEGGTVDVTRIVELMVSGSSVEDFYATTGLKEAGAAAQAVISGGSADDMTEFERLTDNAVSAYLAKARYVPFGEQPVIFHLAAKEVEFTAVRIIMTGLAAGIAPQTIRERLREIYV